MAIANLKHAFHAALVDPAVNSALSRAYSAIGAQMQTALAANYGPDHGTPGDIADSHLEIIDATELGDEAAAFDTIQAHILRAVEATLIVLDGDSSALLRPTRDLYEK